MADAKFDVLFAGELTETANPEGVRQQLQQRFMLSDKVAAQLFAGGTFALRRGVDVTTAARYRDAFRDSGAIVRIRQVAASQATPETPTAEPQIAPAGARSARVAKPERSELRLQTAAQQSQPLETQPAVRAPVVDFSHLSLVPGNDWTLEDCQPPPIRVKLPDTSHLTLVPARDGSEEPWG